MSEYTHRDEIRCKRAVNHKRKKPKKCRSGCLMCKPQKCNGWSWARRYPKLAAYAKQDEALG